MKKLIILTMISAFFFACPTIKQNNNCSRYEYTFDIPVSFNPTDSIIHIGDTITITSQFSNVLKTNETNELFVFDSVDFKTGSGFVRFDTLLEKGEFYHFTDEFEFIIDSIYNFRKSNNVIAFDYYYNGEEYYLQYKFIPKVKGIFLFEYISRINTSTFNKNKTIQAKNSDCETSGWYPSFITNQGNNYRELLKLSPNEDYYTTVYNDWSRYNTEKGAHCFKVE